MVIANRVLKSALDAFAQFKEPGPSMQMEFHSVACHRHTSLERGRFEPITSLF
jgi:hypothetical protein